MSSRFRNQDPTDHAGFFDLLKWGLHRDRGAWRRVEEAPGPPPPTEVARGDMRVTLVGHATLLVQMDGLNLLTDPIWSDRCSPVSFAGPRRFRVPGLRFEDLPPIHAVFLSHDHYDHLDVPTLRRLHDVHRPHVFTGLGNRARLAGHGIHTATELDWWDATTFEGTPIHCVPARHFSGRGLTDRDRTLWAGFVVEGAAGSLYFAGDTGHGRHFVEIRERLGAPRLALLPIGAYRPEWFMRAVHLTPADAVRAHRELEATTSAAIHYGTFALADDGQEEPVRDLRAALAPGERFLVLDHGRGLELPSVEVAQAAS